MREFDFINNIKELFSLLPSNGFEGIGDDCAVFPISSQESLLFTSDMLVERVHFTLESCSAYNLGVKSLAVNLSDIAASGGRPVATLLSLSLPKDIEEQWAEEFMRGYHSLSQKHGVALVGGDTTSSKGQVTINVTAIGVAKNEQIKRRSAAKAGDLIMVTGSLGDSAMGLRALQKGDTKSPYIDAHLCPTPRIEEGLWLASQEAVGAMMDISDGVASDLHHIMTSSRVGARINLETIPTTCDVELALCGGEDYELLFTVDCNYATALIDSFKKLFATSITPIGEITSGEDIEWVSKGEVQTKELMGYRHF